MVRVRRAAKKGGGVREKKVGAKKRGVHAAQAPPLNTPMVGIICDVS